MTVMTVDLKAPTVPEDGPGYDKMDPEIKTKWVTALRSGELHQTRGRLRRGGEEGGVDADVAYCCLGVLCEIGVADGVIDANRRPLSYDGYRMKGSTEEVWSEMMPDPDIRQWAGLDVRAMDELADMNDTQGMSFAQIADYIEEHL